MILAIFPRKMKVFDTFGTKVIKLWGSLLSDFGVEKIEKVENDPLPLQLSTEEYARDRREKYTLSGLIFAWTKFRESKIENFRVDKISRISLFLLYFFHFHRGF